jgi:hypothetical protein
MAGANSAIQRVYEDFTNGMFSSLGANLSGPFGVNTGHELGPISLLKCRPTNVLGRIYRLLMLLPNWFF